MPKVLNYLDGVDYRHLSEKEINSKGIREIYGIFYIYNNCGINDLDIGLIAKNELKMTGYDGMTLGDIIRGKIYRWNNLFPKNDPRVILKPRIQGESKGRWYLEPIFAEKVFKDKNNSSSSSTNLPDNSLKKTPFNILDSFDTLDKDFKLQMTSFGSNSSNSSNSSYFDNTPPCFLDEPFTPCFLDEPFTPQQHIPVETNFFCETSINSSSDFLFDEYLNN